MNTLDLVAKRLNTLNGLVITGIEEYSLKGNVSSSSSTQLFTETINFCTTFFKLSVSWKPGRVSSNYMSLKTLLKQAETKLAVTVNAQDKLMKLVSTPTVTTIGDLIANSSNLSEVQVQQSVAELRNFLTILEDNNIDDVIYELSSADAKTTMIEHTFETANDYLNTIEPSRIMFTETSGFSTPYDETLIDRSTIRDFTIDPNFVFSLANASTLSTNLGGSSLSRTSLESFLESSLAAIIHAGAVGENTVAVSFVNNNWTKTFTTPKYLGVIEIFSPEVHGADPRSNYDIECSIMSLQTSLVGVKANRSDLSGTLALSIIATDSLLQPTTGIKRTTNVNVTDGDSSVILEDVFSTGTSVFLHIYIDSSSVASTNSVANMIRFRLAKSESFPNEIATDHLILAYDRNGNETDLASMTIDQLFSRLTLIPDSSRAGLISHLDVTFDNNYKSSWSKAISIMCQLSSADAVFQSFKSTMQVTWTDKEIENYLRGGVTRWLLSRSDIRVNYSVLYDWLKVMMRSTTSSVTTVQYDMESARRFLYGRR